MEGIQNERSAKVIQAHDVTNTLQVLRAWLQYSVEIGEDNKRQRIYADNKV